VFEILKHDKIWGDNLHSVPHSKFWKDSSNIWISEGIFNTELKWVNNASETFVGLALQGSLREARRNMSHSVTYWCFGAYRAASRFMPSAQLCYCTKYARSWQVQTQPANRPCRELSKSSHLTRVSVRLIVGPKCTLAASNAAPWSVIVSMPTRQTDGHTDERQTVT